MLIQEMSSREKSELKIINSYYKRQSRIGFEELNGNLQENGQEPVDLDVHSVFESYDPVPKENKKDSIEVKTRKLPLLIDLSLGSSDIIQILYYYATSNSEKFILSDWKYIVENRWNRFWVLHLAESLIFWIVSILFLLYAIFLRGNTSVKIFALVFLIISLLYKSFRLIGFCFFKVSV